MIEVEKLGETKRPWRSKAQFLSSNREEETTTNDLLPLLQGSRQDSSSANCLTPIQRSILALIDDTIYAVVENTQTSVKKKFIILNSQ